MSMHACSCTFASSHTTTPAYILCNGGTFVVLVFVFTFNTFMTLCRLKSCYFDVSDNFGKQHLDWLKWCDKFIIRFSVGMIRDIIVSLSVILGLAFSFTQYDTSYQPPLHLTTKISVISGTELMLSITHCLFHFQEFGPPYPIMSPVKLSSICFCFHAGCVDVCRFIINCFVCMGRGVGVCVCVSAWFSETI